MYIIAPAMIGGAALTAFVVGPALVAVYTMRNPVERPVPIGGVLAIVVSIGAVALSGADIAVWGLAAGTLLTLGAGFAARRGSWVAVLRVIVGVPGMAVAVLAWTRVGEPWVLPVSILVGACIGAAADEVDARYSGTGMTMLMATITASGLYVMLPETGLIAPIAGALIVLAVLGWPLDLVRLGPGGGSAVITLFTAISVHGGQFRSSAIVGGIVAPAMLFLLAWTPQPSPLFSGRPAGSTTIQLVALHAIVTLGLSRIAGLQASPVAAALIATPLLFVGWWAASEVVRGRSA